MLKKKRGQPGVDPLKHLTPEQRSEVARRAGLTNRRRWAARKAAAKRWGPGGAGYRKAMPAHQAITQAAKQLGSIGGKVGGPARAAALSARERSAIAAKGAAARWGTGTDAGAVKIEKGIPIPPPRLRLTSMWPLETMEVGDSFLVPPELAGKARRCYHRARALGIEVVMRGSPEGVRVWRSK